MEGAGKISFQVRESRMSLVTGGVSIAFAAFIFVMWLLHPKREGGGLLLYLPLLFMLGSGIWFCIVYFHKRVTVEEMTIHYVNSLKKSKQFTLDEIGFCKLEIGGGKITLAIYDLMGEKLCKLDFGMRGMGEFLQYLVDNRVKTELSREKRRRQMGEAFLPELILKETAVCAEEIGKYAAAFYLTAEQIFREWEKRNRKFEAQWEFGFAEYTAGDLERQAKQGRHTGSWEWSSSVEAGMRELPEDYTCVLEAYLKKNGQYVVNRRGEAVSVQIPYLVRCRSYQIGEGTRIRKSDEGLLAEEMEGYLEVLSKELPRHRYRTETLTLGHALKKTLLFTGQESALAAHSVRT